MKHKHTLLLLALLAVVALSSAQVCSINVPDNEKLDCLPDQKVLPNPEETCLSYGCCWVPPKNKSIGLKIGVPSCYFASNLTSYMITGLRATEQGHTAELIYVGSAGRSNPIKNLTLDILHSESNNIVNVKIYDPNANWYLLEPKTLPLGPSWKFSRNFNVEVANNALIIRDKDSRLLFSTAVNAPIIYADQFIQISTLIESKYAYGFGETSDVFAKPTNTWRQYSLFALDQSPSVGVNSYGVHPFGMFLREDFSSYGIFLYNSNAMDIEITPQPTLTFRTIGGIIDLYLYAGDTPQDVAAQHSVVVGEPIMPPYWAFGFHLGRWGYGNQSNLEAVLNRNLDSGFPIEAQWLDVDTLDRARSWTVDSINFPNLPQLVEKLHSKNMKVVSVVHPGVSKDPNFTMYNTGLEENVFTKNDGEILVGQSLSGDTVFTNFFLSNSIQWWKSNAQNYYDNYVKFDGLWLDKNVPTNFVNGSNKGCLNSTYDNPPYKPQVGADGANLAFKTICMSSDTLHPQIKHYHWHSIYGHSQVQDTNIILSRILPGKKSFVMTKSTFPGTGRYGHHWTGEIESSWAAMEQSIRDILNFNLFGIPFVGADICGYHKNAEEEMCLRWMQLGAYYPFMRNHNEIGNIDQDPAAWKNYGAQMRNALAGRYSMVPYWYTLHYRTSRYFRQTVIRPLWWEFPTDEKTWTIETQFMVGSAVMVVPVLKPVDSKTKIATVRSYFPEGDWYSVTGSKRRSSANEDSLQVTLDEIPVFYRGGSIIPMQKPRNTTYETRKFPYTLLVALKYPEQTASGSLYIDNGEDGAWNNLQALFLQFKTSNNWFRSSVDEMRVYDPVKDGFSCTVDKIIFFGFDRDQDFGSYRCNISGKSYDANLGRIDLDVTCDLRYNFEIYWDDVTTTAMTTTAASSNLMVSSGLLALLLLIQRMIQ